MFKICCRTSFCRFRMIPRCSTWFARLTSEIHIALFVKESRLFQFRSHLPIPNSLFPFYLHRFLLVFTSKNDTLRHFLLTFRIFFLFKCEGTILKVCQHLRVVDICHLFHSITNSNAALNEFSYFKMCVRLIRRAMTRTYVLLFAFRHV